MSLLEGLRYSEEHCSRVLSVAGFFAFPARFLAGKEFILRGEREDSLRLIPSLFDNPGITVIFARVPGTDGVQTVCVPGMCRVVYTYWVYQGGIYRVV